MADDGCISAFVAEQRELLELELQAENDLEGKSDAAGGKGGSHVKPTPKGPSSSSDDEERPSHILGQLEASGVSVGLYGRTVVQLSVLESSRSTTATSSSRNDDGVATSSTSSSSRSSSSTPLLPAHRFTVGDEVEIRGKGGGSSGNKKSKTVGGVINAVADTFISVALFQDRRSSAKDNANKNKNRPAAKKNNDKNSAAKSNVHDDDDEQASDLLQQVPLTIVPMSSVEVHRKMLGALQVLERQGVDHPVAGNVIKAMFYPSKNDGVFSTNTAPPSQQVNSDDNSRLPPFNPNLDQSQLEAIEFALRKDRPVALVHGPPGTGKTTTIAELIRQAVHRHGMRVLVTAPSNVAVDNILERLAENTTTSSAASRKTKDSTYSKTLKMVRLGHPARIKSSVVAKYSLEALVQSAEGTEIVQDVRHELQTFLKLLANPKSKSQDKRIAYRELKGLRKEIRTREERVVQHLISSANVVLATTIGASNRVLNDKRGDGDASLPSGFDLVVIDEAAQALEASCWIPILRGRKVVLAGDHCQLPPTIKSKDRRAVSGLSRTMFERLMKLYETSNEKGESSRSANKHRISRMLQIQYRMHQDIADWASQAMYNGDLLTHESVRNRTLGQLASVIQRQQTNADDVKKIENDDDLIGTSLLLIDTVGCDMHEHVTAAGSRFNEGEASIVNQHARRLLDLGLKQEEIAIISPYNGQVELLRSLLLFDFPKLEIRSVDGFQGGEKEAVILSLVRSSDRGGHNGIGFLRDDRRQNVAVTRAKRHLAVICDTETVNQSPFIRTLITWMEDHGDQRSAVEYFLNSDPKSKGYEENLMKLVESAVPPASSPTKKISSPQKEEDSILSNQRNEELEESKRKALMDKIAVFAETAEHGERLEFSSELTSFDRRLVHEFAEQLGVFHDSEGVDGVDRRIILTIKRSTTEVYNPATRSNVEAEEHGAPPSEEHVDAAPSSSFAALALEGSDDDSDEPIEQETPIDDNGTNTSDKIEEKPLRPGNALLSELAKERAARQQQQQQQPQQRPQQQASSNKKKTKKKSKGKQTGGPEKGDELGDLDDMAFLDAQIDKAQNAHGRKVVGGGTNYRTIVNGILNARPEPRAKPANARASAALQSKLKEAETSRKMKTKKKK